MGTSFLRAPFSNPAVGRTPRLAVSVSSVDSNQSAPPSVICSRNCEDEGIDPMTGLNLPTKALRTRWNSALPAWVQVDFGEGCSMKVMRYSLRSGATMPGSDTMVDWELQGRIVRRGNESHPSLMRERWVVLSKHTGDASLLEADRAGGGGWASWVVRDQRSRSIDVDSVRIVMMSPNSSGNTSLVLRGIEFYGEFTDEAHPSC